MANFRISGLNNLTNLLGSDEFPVNRSDTYKTTLDEIKNYVMGYVRGLLDTVVIEPTFTRLNITKSDNTINIVGDNKDFKFLKFDYGDGTTEGSVIRSKSELINTVNTISEYRLCELSSGAITITSLTSSAGVISSMKFDNFVNNIRNISAVNYVLNF